VFTRCAACHHPGGSAFSLMSYAEANPWANAIKEQVLRRAMPPWGAVKGFGSFRNDQSLIQGELDLFEKWVNGGAPEGNPDDLPTRPRVLLPSVVPPAPQLVASGAFRISPAIHARWILGAEHSSRAGANHRAVSGWPRRALGMASRLLGQIRPSVSAAASRSPCRLARYARPAGRRKPRPVASNRPLTGSFRPPTSFHLVTDDSRHTQRPATAAK
jgi:hypothetical protein